MLSNNCCNSFNVFSLGSPNSLFFGKLLNLTNYKGSLVRKDKFSGK